MLTQDDLIWLLNNLPKDLVQSIIAAYNPSCLFLMDDLLNYDWNYQSRLIFNLPCQDAYSYYCLCLRSNMPNMQIACGGWHSFVKIKDRLFSCGYNQYGQLGFGDSICRGKFEEITDAPNNISQIACTDYQTVIMTLDGTVMTCSNGLAGKLSKINYPKGTIQIACGNGFTLALQADGSINSRDEPYINDLDLPKDVVRIACGRKYIIIMRSNGVLLECSPYSYVHLDGVLRKGEFKEILGVPKNITQIACGEYHVIIATEDGTLMARGNNDKGQLGLGDTTERLNFVKIPLEFTDISQIACGAEHSVIIRKNGTLWCCGGNEGGQLGLCDYNNRWTFTENNTRNIAQVACGGRYTLIMTNSGEFMSCGYNTYGQLGLGKKKLRQFAFEKIILHNSREPELSE